MFLSIVDARIMSDKGHIKCTSEEIVENLHDLIVKAYPSATIIYDNSKYYKKTNKIGITIKIGIAGYHAGFGSDIKVGIGMIGDSFATMAFPQGKWNALTAYNIKIYDYREGEVNEQSKDISDTDSASNMFGYSSAKKCLKKTYLAATQALFSFIDNVLME